MRISGRPRKPRPQTRRSLQERSKIRAVAVSETIEIQQQKEMEKLEMCKKNIDETEDSIKVENNNKADLAETNQVLTNTLATPASLVCVSCKGLSTTLVDHQQHQHQP